MMTIQQCGGEVASVQGQFHRRTRQGLQGLAVVANDALGVERIGAGTIRRRLVTRAVEMGQTTEPPWSFRGILRRGGDQRVERVQPDRIGIGGAVLLGGMGQRIGKALQGIDPLGCIGRKARETAARDHQGCIQAGTITRRVEQRRQGRGADALQPVVTDEVVAEQDGGRIQQALRVLQVVDVTGQPLVAGEQGVAGGTEQAAPGLPVQGRERGIGRKREIGINGDRAGGRVGRCVEVGQRPLGSVERALQGGGEIQVDFHGRFRGCSSSWR